MQSFEVAYNKLNKEQKDAVDSIQGPVMVMAGPGTGKTQILTLRIANILRLTDTPPEAILAITFTESGVIAMRRRLASIIGSDAFKVKITTFHGFANDLIMSNPDIFDHLAGRQSLTDIDQVALLEDIFNNNFFKEIKPSGEPLLYLFDAKQAIDTLKREGIAPERFRQLIKEEEEICLNSPDRIHEKGAHKGKVKNQFLDWEKWINRNHELAFVYEEYKKKCRTLKLYDFSDMIMEVASVLEKHPDFKSSVQETFQYLLIDEHQDTNNAQNRIIELIADYDDSPNLFIVGDAKQGIFRFQGASLENFNYFSKKFPKSKIINLSENYRSSQNILDAAHNITPSDHSLRSNAQENHPITIAEFSRQELELQYISNEIKDKISSGTKPQNIAIIYRQNREADAVIASLQSKGIPYCLNSNRDILSDQRIKNLVNLFILINNPDLDENFIKAIHSNFINIKAIDILKLIRLNHDSKKHLIDITTSSEIIDSAEIDSKDAILNFSQNILRWFNESRNIPLLNLFENVIKESGFLEFANRQNDAIQLHEKLTLFFDVFRGIVERNPKANLGDFISHLTTIEKHKLRIKYTPLVKDGVQLMTAHASKGLEFEDVYIINATEKIWGRGGRASLFHLPGGVFKLTSTPDITKNDDISDEQNLFYVALTRAKNNVTISYSVTKSDGKEQLPSQFISAINDNLKTVIDTSGLKFELSESMMSSSNIDSDDISEYINNLLDNQGLNVSALNNFIKCPWKYFYINLIRIPQAPSKSSAFGTAVHATLDHYFRNREISETELLGIFEEIVDKQHLSSIEISELKDKGREVITNYIEHYARTWQHRTINELLISKIPFDDRTFLRGQIDMVELIDDGNSIDDLNFYSGPVSVYDFKTGSPKSRNSIEKSDGQHYDYYRQLSFYKLILDSFKSGSLKMQLGFIDFIETDDKGKFHREAFTISEEDIVSLRGIITDAILKIRSFSFKDSKCEEAECSFCILGASLNKKPLS